MSLFKKIIKQIFSPVLQRLCGRELYEKIQFWRGVGYWPDFKNPKSFTEKTCAYKLYHSPADAHVLCDKWAVREYVKARGCGDLLNETYACTDVPERIDWASLPDRFVAKGTHGSGEDFLMLVKDKSTLTREAFIKKAKKIIATPYGKYSNEPWYLKIKPRIIVERWLPDKNHFVPPDYKFMVFHGRVHSVFITTGRYIHTAMTWYDREWNRLPFTIDRPFGPDIPKPENLQKMIEIAETLAAGHTFLRIDLYNLDNGEIVFGEVTICQSGGWHPFKPNKSYDFLLGENWVL